VPGVALVDRAVRSAFGDLANTATLYVALGAMAVWMFTAYKSINFTCPRCGGGFFRTWDERPWRQTTRSNLFARRCMNCGLPKWAPADPEPADAK